MELGVKIKKVRELRNFTQEYMAEKLHMSQAGYSKIETGEVDVPFSRLTQISEALGMRVEDVIAFDEKHVFNIMHNKVGIGINHAPSISDRERELYEENIKLLKEKIQYLEGKQ